MIIYFIYNGYEVEKFNECYNFLMEKFKKSNQDRRTFLRKLNICILSKNSNSKACALIDNYLFEHGEKLYFINSKIYNINEIKEKLCLENSEGTLNNLSDNDNYIFFKYFLYRGKEAFKEIIGKWCFISLDIKTNEILLARDHLGWENLYFVIEEENFLATNYFQVLKKLYSSIESINLKNIFSLALGYYGKSIETPITKIKKVHPASFLIINNKKIDLFTYWKPYENEKIKYSKLSYYGIHFLNIFTDVVREILPKNDFAVTLSSGHDSSFVTCFIADLMKEKGKKFYAITSVPKFDINENSDKYLYNEYKIAKHILEKYKNIESITDNAKNYSLLNSLVKALEVHGYPIRNALNQYWILSLYENLKERGINNLIWAQNGNITLSWPKYYNILFFNVLLAKAKIAFFKRRIFKPSFLKRNYFKPEAIKKHKLIDALIEDNKDTFLLGTSNEKEKIRIFNFVQKIGFTYLREKEFYFDIESLDPTSDPRIIDYCFSIPNEVFVSKKGTKVFYKEIAKNFVPVEIIENKLKGKQASDSLIRFNEEKEEIIKFVSECKKNDFINELINLSNLSEDIIKNEISFNGLAKILRILNVMLFIRDLSEN